jgi:hypothetical protein
MASVFWDAEGILFIDYLEKGKTITVEYYSNLLTRLEEKICEKKPVKKKKKVIYYQDNSLAHKSVLAPSVFFLFPKFKIFLAGHNFFSNH